MKKCIALRDLKTCAGSKFFVGHKSGCEMPGFLDWSPILVISRCILKAARPAH